MKIELLPKQNPHVKRLCNILDTFGVCYDGSETGAGKMVCFLDLVRNFSLENVIVVTSSSVKEQFLDEVKKYTRFVTKTEGEYLEPVEVIRRSRKHSSDFSIDRMDILKVITYPRLAGKASRDGKKKLCCANLLTRREKPVKLANGNIKTDKHGNQTTRPFFRMTEVFKTYLSQYGSECIIWFDEAHNLRNSDTATFDAAKILIKKVMGAGGKVTFSSATPFINGDHSVNFCELTGLIKYEMSGSKKSNVDFGPLVRIANAINPEKTKQIFNKLIGENVPLELITLKLGISLVSELFIEVVFGGISSRMTKEIDVDCHYVDLMYPVSRDVYRNYLSKVEELKKFLQLTSGKNVFNSLIMDMDHIKFDSLVKFVIYLLEKEDFDEHGKRVFNKVLVAYNFTKIGAMLEEALGKYKPVNINGNTKEELREVYKRQFNEPNNEQRVLIFNGQTLNSGADLHDVNGKFPRHLVLLPSYFYLNMTQLSGRIYRTNVKSKSYVYNFYLCPEGDIKIFPELNLYRSIASKKDFLKFSLDKCETYGKSKNLVPGEYPAQVFKPV